MLEYRKGQGRKFPSLWGGVRGGLAGRLQALSPTLSQGEREQQKSKAISIFHFSSLRIYR
jgi:hypothetical protein